MTEKQKQVVAQCRAVAHMAAALVELFSDLARVHEAGHSTSILDVQGRRTAQLLETLGDILNELDCVTDEDIVATAGVLEKAREMFPSEGEAT